MSPVKPTVCDMVGQVQALRVLIRVRQKWAGSCAEKGLLSEGRRDLAWGGAAVASLGSPSSLLASSILLTAAGARCRGWTGLQCDQEPLSKQPPSLQSPRAGACRGVCETQAGGQPPHSGSPWPLTGHTSKGNTFPPGQAPPPHSTGTVTLQDPHGRNLAASPPVSIAHYRPDPSPGLRVLRVPPA